MSFILFGHYIFILFYFLSLSLTLQHFLYSLYYSSVTLIPLLRLRLHFYSKLTFTSLQLSLDILFQADFFICVCFVRSGFLFEASQASSICFELSNMKRQRFCSNQDSFQMLFFFGL